MICTSRTGGCSNNTSQQSTKHSIRFEYSHMHALRKFSPIRKVFHLPFSKWSGAKSLDVTITIDLLLSSAAAYRHSQCVEKFFFWKGSAHKNTDKTAWSILFKSRVSCCVNVRADGSEMKWNVGSIKTYNSCVSNLFVGNCQLSAIINKCMSPCCLYVPLQLIKINVEIQCSRLDVDECSVKWANDKQQQRLAHCALALHACGSILLNFSPLLS